MYSSGIDLTTKSENPNIIREPAFDRQVSDKKQFQTPNSTN